MITIVENRDKEAAKSVLLSSVETTSVVRFAEVTYGDALKKGEFYFVCAPHEEPSAKNRGAVRILRIGTGEQRYADGDRMVFHHQAKMIVDPL